MSLAYVIVDVFADTPLRGNQLAVFEDGSALSDDQMQRLAREMNLSETVFLLPAQARSPQGTGQDPVLHDFSPIWSCGASLRTGLSVRGRLQRYMSLGEQLFGTALNRVDTSGRPHSSRLSVRACH